MSRQKVRRHPDVANDIVEIATHIAHDSVTTAYRFWEAAEKTFLWLLAHPGAGHRLETDTHRTANVRSWAVKGFPNHIIIYEVESGGIRVAAVVHGARDIPRFLRQRLGRS